MKKRIILSLFSCLLFIQGNFAQADLQDPLPQDPNVVVGKLPNGITYYLRHNEEPKDRASFYIIRNAGALLENDDQDGLAHFLEHMAFQGTKNFPGKGIITTLEKHGVAFGRNINAYTAHNETVYNLSSVPTTNPALLDTCLLILHDWSYYLTLDDEEIDAERGVISEEWRTRRTAAFRIQRQTFPVLFKGSKYAIRDVIGSLDVIQNFKYQTIRDFYHKWYRTDLEAIAIVGDFDVKQMEQRVKDILSDVPAIENPTPRPFYEIPEHDETYYCLATDKEAQNSSISITNFFPEVSAKEKNTHAYLKNNIITSFYNSMVRARISELMQQANPPFLGGNIGFGGFVRGYNAYNVATTAKPNEEALALETILTENERIKRFGFTPSELERAKTNMLVGLESAYKEKDKTDNESYIEDMQSNFLEEEPMVDFEYYYQYATQLIPTITVEEVNAKAQEWASEKNRSITISGPSENTTHLTKEEALAIMDKVAKADIAPYHDAVSDASLINEELSGSKIIKTKPLPQFDAVEWTLENGAKVVFRKADYEKDAVALTSYSKGGTSLYDDKELLPSAQNASSFTKSFGIGDFDAITLRKLLTGKMASCSVSISGMSEAVSGSSTPNDFETMLQLLYLRFEKPRFDKEVFASIMNRNRATLPNMLKNPQKIMQDSLQLIMSNYHPRTLLYNEDYLNKISLEKIEQVYRDRIKDASDFTFFIVGNIDENTVKPLVEKYIGSLKSENRKENWKDNKVRGPKGKVTKEIELELEQPKSTVITNFSKDMPYSVYNSRCIKILEGILDLRYTENIREKEGGTYGVSVQGSVMRQPYSNYSMTMSFDCDPAKANHLKSLVYAEVEKLMKEAPTQEELNKVVNNLRKNREQSKNHNNYWLNAIYGYYVNGINSADPKNFEEILDKITPKDIQKFTKTMFKGANVVDVIFKPKAK
ncbi:MAG: insulinase family protein [Odoribacter sp.]|nr:insulinase family protein [Odoribacter sp.]